MGEQEKDFDLSDLLDDDKVGENQDDKNDNDLDALKTQIEELTKEKQGLLTATKEERKKRQDLSAKLNQLEGAVGGILSQRQHDTQVLESVTKDDTSKGIPVDYDDDGNAWVDPKNLASVVSPYEQKVADLEQQLQLATASNQAALEAEKVKQAIIGEDERYESAAGKYRAARKWVEETVVGFAKVNNVGRSLTSGEALDHVFDKALREEFSDKFGDMDLIDIVTAEDSKDHFKRTLDHIATSMNPDTGTALPKDKLDSRFQKVLNKPSGLGKQANAKAGQLTITDKVTSLSSTDIMDLTDAQVEALQRAMGVEEKEDGIKF